MAQFKTQYSVAGEVKLKPFKKGLFKLAEDIQIKRTTEAGVERFDVSEGFITDMGSVPRIFRRWFPYIGNQYLSACYILHDALYATQDHCHALSKQRVDEILWEMITFLPTGVAKWKIGLIWKAVDWFGWTPWDTFDQYDRIAIRKKELEHRWDVD